MCHKTIGKFALLLIISAYTGTSLAAESCVGYNFTQPLPTIGRVKPPKVSIITAIPASIYEEEVLYLSATASVDTTKGGKPFFSWCTQNGTLAYDSNYRDDGKTVKFIAPVVSHDEYTRISVQVGDGLGYVSTQSVFVNILTGTATSNLFDQVTGELKIAGDLSNPGTITVDGQTIQGNWLPDSVTFNLYDATGTNFSTFWQPVQLEIFDANGVEIYSGCFPFKDVCPKRWYTQSVIKLWKEEIIEGYNNGKSATFGTYNNTTRAEFIAALVRALEQGNTPEPLTSDPFADVSKDDWYAPYVDYAAKLGLIQGCDKINNLFCPNNSITRAEAMKILVLAYRHLKQLAVDYARGKTPKKIYSDVTDSEQWFYPYIYAAQEINVAHGYRDGTFEPHSPLNRAEMAKVICIAEFGMMACTDMGDRTNKSLVLTTSPYKAQLNEVTTFTVYGINLTESMSLSVQDCNNITRTEHTVEQQTYTCTPSSIGTKTIKVKDETGKTIYPSTVIVEGVVEPVTLPGDTSEPPTDEPTTEPPVDETPVEDPVEPPVDEPPTNDSCSPEVSDVSPLSATLGKLTTFTVTGSCLPDTTAFYIDECSDTQPSGGNEQQRQFSCTPGYKTGSHGGLVKDKSGGTVLLSFDVDFQWGTPKVEDVTPKTVQLNQVTDFMIKGSSLPKTTVVWIDGCDGLVMFEGDANDLGFQCTPTVAGTMTAVVKDQPGGTELYNFTVNVQ